MAGNLGFISTSDCQPSSVREEPAKGLVGGQSSSPLVKRPKAAPSDADKQRKQQKNNRFASQPSQPWFRSQCCFSEVYGKHTYLTGFPAGFAWPFQSGLVVCVLEFQTSVSTRSDANNPQSSSKNMTHTQNSVASIRCRRKRSRAVWFGWHLIFYRPYAYEMLVTVQPSGVHRKLNK